MNLPVAPGRLAAAAGNLGHLLLHRGLADLTPTPRAKVGEGERHRLYVADGSRATGPGSGTADPVLLVPSPVTPVSCFDLRRGCSLVEHLAGTGRSAYLLELDAVSPRDRSLGLDPWVSDTVPEAIRATSAHAGGRPVHLVGWSLGGVLTLLAAADSALPIASLTLLGVPAEVATVPLIAPERPLLTAGDWPDPIPRLSRALPLTSAPPISWLLDLDTVQRLVTTPAAVALHLDDAEWLAQVQAVAAFSAGITAYPGRTYGRVFHRFVADEAVAAAAPQVGRPTLVIAGNTDGIAPLSAVRAVLPQLSGAPEVRFEIVPGGHLGQLTGRAARHSTWPVLDEWFARWDGAEAPPERPRTSPTKKAPAKKTPAKKTAAKKTAAKKTSAKKAPAKKTPAKKPAGGADAIGANPERRYSSASSRALRP